MEGDGRLRGQGGVDISDSSRCVQVYTLASKPDATYLPTYERDGERNGQFCDGAAAAAQVGDAKSSLGDVESSLGDTKSSLGDAKSSQAAAHKPTRVPPSGGIQPGQRACPSWWPPSGAPRAAERAAPVTIARSHSRPKTARFQSVATRCGPKGTAARVLAQVRRSCRRWVGVSCHAGNCFS